MYYALILIFGVTTANDLTLKGQYEESEKLLAKQKDHNPQWHYLRMINLHFMNDRSCLEHAEFLLSLEGYTKCPERYIALAWSIKYDVQTNWRKEDKLNDIFRDMRRVSRRLENSKGGENTQDLQNEIVNKLTKMIDKMEEKQKKQEMANAEKERKEYEKQLGKPMRDSRIANDSGMGRVQQKKIREIAKNWGRLPPKERAKAMVELSREIPPRYRDAIENYFKEIAQWEEYKKRMNR